MESFLGNLLSFLMIASCSLWTWAYAVKRKFFLCFLCAVANVPFALRLAGCFPEFGNFVFGAVGVLIVAPALWLGAIMSPKPWNRAASVGASVAVAVFFVAYASVLNFVDSGENEQQTVQVQVDDSDKGSEENSMTPIDDYSTRESKQTAVKPLSAEDEIDELNDEIDDLENALLER